MSVIYCFVCGNHSDTDFYPCEEVVNISNGGIELACEECAEAIAEGEVEGYYLLSDKDNYDESMDGDHESGLASAGFGTDEDYGYYGDDSDHFCGEDY